MKTWPLISSACLSLLLTVSAVAAEKQKPYPHYWITVATTSQNLPGMSAEMGGMSAMFGGKNPFAPRRELQLQLESPQTSAAPKAEHLIPPGQKMGEALPLVRPVVEKSGQSPERYQQPAQYEKPKARMLIYWGCGETIGQGQPKIIDTATMSMADFGKALAGRTATRQTAPAPRKGWTYAEWPDKKNQTDIPADSSLVGRHKITGNYLIPEIQFSLGAKHDYMAAVEFEPLATTATGASTVVWKPVPTAIGYFATAMGHNQETGETIFWSASQVPETGFGLLDYLTAGDVNRFIKEKVVLPASTTSCTVPPIFKGDQPGMLQFIAYGEELNLAHPPKPKDPKQRWDIEWSAKVRLKSTSMLPLMAAEKGDTPRKARSSRKSKKQVEQQEEGQYDTPSQQKQQDKEGDGSTMKGMGNRLKGMFGF